MKRNFSYKWIQSFFDEELPIFERLVEKIMNHSFEVEVSEILENDSVVRLDILANRPDCLGHCGLAREISAMTNIEIADDVFEEKQKLNFEVSDDINIKTDGCLRYTITKIENCDNIVEPKYIPERLNAIGQKSIFPIVNVSNYILYDVGQPNHIFDADVVSGKFVLCDAEGGEEFVGIDDGVIICNKGDVLIKDAKTGDILGLAGIIGAKHGSITEATKNIYVEVASFDNVRIRKTLRSHALQKDAGRFFSQGINGDLIPYTAKRLVDLLIETTLGTSVYSIEAKDYIASNKSFTGIQTKDYKKLIGSDIDERRLLRILFLLGFKCTKLRNPRAHFVELGKSLLGAKYKYGSSITKDAPVRFDCSSFTAYLALMSGKPIPRISINQYLSLNKVDKPKEGDLFFVKKVGKNASAVRYESIFEEGFPVEKAESKIGVNHLGVLLNDNKILEALGSPVSRVVINDLEKYSNKSEVEIVGYKSVFENEEENILIEIPIYRTDITYSVDIIEELARMIGYTETQTSKLKESGTEVEIDKQIKLRHLLIGIFTKLGFSEVMTYSFRERGEVYVKEGIAKDKQALRNNLGDGLKESLDLNTYNGDLLGLERVGLFEFGSVFKKDNKEEVNFAIAMREVKGHQKIDYEQLSQELEGTLQKEGIDLKIEFKDGIFETSFSDMLEKLGNVEFIKLDSVEDVLYKKISKYPFVLRDISVWVDADKVELEKLIKDNSKDLLKTITLFDTYKKNDLFSYAYRLVFQSEVETLNDEFVNGIMSDIEAKIKDRGWKVR